MTRNRRFAGGPIKKETQKETPPAKKSGVTNRILQIPLKAFQVLLKLTITGFLLFGLSLVGIIVYVANNPVYLDKPPQFISAVLDERIPDYKVQLGEITVRWDMSARAFVARAKEAKFVAESKELPTTTIPQLELHFPLVNLLQFDYLPGMISISDLNLSVTVPEAKESVDVIEQVQQALSAARSINDISVHKAQISLNFLPSGKVLQLALVGYKSKDYMRVVASLPTVDSKKFNIELITHDAVTWRAMANLENISPQELLAKLPALDAHVDESTRKILEEIANKVEGKVGVEIHVADGLTDVFTDVRLGPGKLLIPSLHKRPYDVKSARIDLSYGLHGFFIKNTDIVLPEGKIAVHANAPYTAKTGAHSGKIIIKGSDLEVPRLKDVWPEGLALDARNWIVENIHKGTIPKITLNADYNSRVVRTAAGLSVAEVMNASNHTLSGISGYTVLRDSTVEYMDGMPLVTDISGSGPFDANTFNLAFKSGKSGNIHVTEGLMIISGLQDKDQFMDLRIKTRSDLRSALELIDEKPLGLLREYDISPQNFAGDATVDLRLTFPLEHTLTPEKLKAEVTGRATDAKMLRLVEAYDLGLEKGDFTISVKNFGEAPALHVRGVAMCLGEEVKIEAEDKFNIEGPEFKDLESKRITVVGNLTPAHIARLWPQFKTALKGKAPLTLVRKTYNRLAGEPNGELIIDLQTTPALVDVPVIKLHKPHDEAAVLQLRYTLADDDIVSLDQAEIVESDRLRLSANAHWDKASKKLKRAKLEMNFPENDIEYVYTDTAAGASGNMRVGRIDIKELIRLLAESESEDKTQKKDAQQHKIEVHVHNLDYGDRTLLDELRGSLTLEEQVLVGGSLEGQRVRGEGIDKFSLVARTLDDGELEYQISADNLESLFAALEFEAKVKSDKVEVKLHRRKDGNKGWKGSYKLKNFLLANAPPVIKLLKVLSPTAITQIFSQEEGVVLNSVTGGFRYHDDVLHLTQGRAASPSVGFTYEGAVELDTQTLDISGTLIPAYGINAAVGYIPIVGHILSGGPGRGLVAISFTMTGTYDDPKINSNPLSALAPGIVKRIFSDAEQDKREAKHDKPKTDEKANDGPVQLPGVAGSEPEKAKEEKTSQESQKEEAPDESDAS